MQSQESSSKFNNRKLGKVAKVVDVQSEVMQYLTFFLGKEMFAVDILVIKEILQYGEVTSVPLMPPYLRGVINLRGAVVPVIDLAYRLGKGLSAEAKRSCIVILEVPIGQQVVNLGMMVDAVSAVIDIAKDQIEAAPALGGTVRTDFIAGMGKLPSGFVIILDVAHIFSGGELESLA
ncbi:MAG: purine-binding chemotaxis protein CheW, partial [Burkholderiales bacterium]|nr:purine-binding chemotaxis protein CheW [Burkholderiales bacterium]